MSRFVLLGLAAVILTAARAQEIDDSIEIEPPILPQNLKDDATLSKAAAAEPVLDIAKLEKDLARARKSAASAERLFKIGALAKVEAENRLLKVVRLESELENARLSHAKEGAVSQPSETDTNQAAKSDVDLARAIHVAHAAAAKRAQAELEAAALNLFRQQKLLALGSGSKASVRRAEEKLAQLQATPP